MQRPHLLILYQETFVSELDEAWQCSAGRPSREARLSGRREVAEYLRWRNSTTYTESRC